MRSLLAPTSSTASALLRLPSSPTATASTVVPRRHRFNRAFIFHARGRDPDMQQFEPPGFPKVTAAGQEYFRDQWTNVTPKILSYLGRDLHRRRGHPIRLVKDRINQFFGATFQTNRGSPVFSLHDDLSPVVTIAQNYDSLLVPLDHPSRKKSDSYYINGLHMLRAHTSAHQVDIIKSGLNNFLVAGDCYRRDEIDRSHYPVFHQIEGVRLLNDYELFRLWNSRKTNPNDIYYEGELFEGGTRTEDKQEYHTMDAVKYLEIELKEVLVGLARTLFGQGVQHRWVPAYFPFTHPSWELEVFHSGRWMELLGCGIMEQRLLLDSGVIDRVGWAFGIGLERAAMRMYGIPDIRLFWSEDSGFTSQFRDLGPTDEYQYKSVSKFPQCSNDLSFWLPPGVVSSDGNNTEFSPNDFYDLVRTVGGDMVEQVELLDDFYHPKRQRRSHCYRIVYRSPDRTLTQEEVNELHGKIEQEAKRELKVEVR